MLRSTLCSRAFSTSRLVNLANAAQIKTAGCIIIGDEVLNSKINDTNSRFFGKYCFDNGISLQKIAVVGDDPAEIISTVEEFDHKYDFIVTSGGIGPTHDDVTYDSISKYFGLDQKIDQTAKDKMYATYRDLIATFTEEQKEANLRMVNLPHGPGVQYLYAPKLWVPIVNINDKLNILPGIPRLFENMLLNGIHPQIVDKLDPAMQFVSFYVSTDVRESALAPFLTDLHKSIATDDVKLGSYPHKVLNSVSITGRKKDLPVLRSLVDKCVEHLKGKEITREEEEALSNKSYSI